jgi:hypothetical protein
MERPHTDVLEEGEMRGSGNFQRTQMKRTDLRVNELFSHLRNAIDVLEQIMRRPALSGETTQPN